MGGTDMKRFVLGAVTAIIGVGVIALAVPLTGLYNVAATERDVGPVAWLLHTTYHQSVQRRARDVDVPADYASDASVLIGARNFDAMCSTCHTPPAGHCGSQHARRAVLGDRQRRAHDRHAGIRPDP